MSTKKILSVDDSRMVQTIVGKTFEPYDANLFFANNGEECLVAAAREMPDLIILDVTMPVMDGFEALTRLKADAALKSIPVIMLTAEAGMDNVMKIAKLGVRDYVVKPFTKEGLLERVQKVVTIKEKAAVEEVAPRTLEDRLNILVLDENTDGHESIKTATRDYPWSVTCCSQPKEAAEHALKTPPDLCFVSLSLPNRMALNFFQAIRSDARLQRVPVFGLSRPEDAEAQNEARQAGFASFVPRPITGDALVDTIAQHFKIDRTPRYLSVESEIYTLKFADQLTPSILSTIRREFRDALHQASASSGKLVLLDLSALSNADTGLIESSSSPLPRSARRARSRPARLLPMLL
ncbi:MAG: response regulator [Chthoniobacteraceae bacterium]